jgi:phosphoserine phosphatase RsbU/P
MKILVVEDDPVTQQILRVALEQDGHQVLTASDGEEALQLVASNPVQLTVSDWMMPRMDGLDFCKRIRERESKQYLYFIMLTARAGRIDYFRAMESGVDDFLAKPLRRDDLKIRLRAAERILSYMGQVRELRSLLPMCSYCKRIRDDRDYWHQVEAYIKKHAGIDFSHGICPDCYTEIIVPQLEALEISLPPKSACNSPHHRPAASTTGAP